MGRPLKFQKLEARLCAEIHDVNVSAEADVIGEIPTYMVGISQPTR